MNYEYWLYANSMEDSKNILDSSDNYNYLIELQFWFQ